MELKLVATVSSFVYVTGLETLDIGKSSLVDIGKDVILELKVFVRDTSVDFEADPKNSDAKLLLVLSASCDVVER